jgi:acyl-CoA thioester hydrolase
VAKSDFRFHHSFRIRYSEIDGQGIVFNSHYFTFFDTAIYEYLRGLDFDFNAYIARRNMDFHTVRVELDFMAPARFDEVIEVHARVAKIGRSSLTFVMEIYLQGTDHLLVKGSLVWVHTDQDAHKSAPLPSGLLEMIRGHEALPPA